MISHHQTGIWQRYKVLSFNEYLVEIHYLINKRNKEYCGG
jgi:hypothetical protein